MPYTPPNFEIFSDAPDCPFVPAPADAVLPKQFMSTTNFPTYVKVAGSWYLAQNHRMDAHLVWENGQIITKEFRCIKKGDLIAVALHEDGQDGVLVWDQGFKDNREQSDEAFSFMSSEVSREKPVNYPELIDAFRKNHADGYIVWVIGPALVHSRGREAMEWLIQAGYVDCVLSGNAVGVHDIEAALFGSTLGMKADGSGAAGGHSMHMRAINSVKSHGSIASMVQVGALNSGIMYNLCVHKIPYVLAGSIRDDGPLPETITDALAAQAAMREHTSKATMVVMVATALHSIAVGNMLPTFCVRSDGRLEELATICVDQTEFLVSKLKDRGTHQAFGVVTNAQDFMRIVQLELMESALSY